MNLAQTMLHWADMLRDIAGAGLTFCHNPHDLANYRKVQDISVEMLASVLDQPFANFEPIRTAILSRPTPLCAADAAVINEQGELLLVQRSDNHKWGLPGGYLSVGETPAEGAVREAFEETGLICEPVRLAGVYDSRLCGTVSPHQLYTIVFLCKLVENTGGRIAQLNPMETEAVGWYANADLPQDLVPDHVQRINHAFQFYLRAREPHFDSSHHGDNEVAARTCSQIMTVHETRRRSAVEAEVSGRWTETII